MANYRVRHPTFLRAKGRDVFAHLIQPAALLRAQLGEALPRQINRDSAVFFIQQRYQMPPALRPAARAMQQQ
jgi:hypothetical protein